MKKLYFLFCTLFSLVATAQNKQVIKVRKSNNLVYFFKKGAKTDTVSLNNNLFYFVLADSLKSSTSILIDNARFVKGNNDTTLQLLFMPGLKYEAKYVLDKTDVKQKAFKFTCLINGSTTFNKNEIIIQVISTLQDKPLIENKFYYKD